MMDMGEDNRYGALPGILKIIFLSLTTVGILMSIFYLFSIRVAGRVLMEVTYYYLFIGIYGACCFLILPSRKKLKRVPWYDYLAAVLIFGIGIYFALHDYEISQLGWSSPDQFNFVLALIYCIMLLEAGRRIAGPYFLAVNLIVGLYPLVAEHMPGILYGKGFTINGIVGRNIFGYDGMIGLPSMVVAKILLGFLIFAGILIASGAGKFFLDLSLALLGRFRGGPAKVAVLASGFFGSLSGNPLANIVGTGCVTIPAMKRMGFSPTYAGAIEACASSGGNIMPPVMGATAFIMAGFLGVDYSIIIIVALVPSILYYFGLVMQVDAYAARSGLKGLPREELPTLMSTLKRGWPFAAILIFLVWGLVYMKWSIYTPYYASALMIPLSFSSRETRLTGKKLIDAVAMTGKLITQTTAVMYPLSFILVGIVSTGISGAFTSTLVSVTGGNIFLILIVGVIACYILGMAGLVAPAYIFLALSMAPAAIKAADLNELAVHMFIIYYSILGGITPPVAPGAFVAATISTASPMKTAFTCMRLGVVLYFIPFFFVFNPSLILQGTLMEAVYLFIFCLVGISFIAAGLEGYMLKVGILPAWSRLFMILAGFLIAFPEWNTTFIGAALAVFLLAIMFLRKRRVGEKNATILVSGTPPSIHD